jgi:hypothetical protein
LPGAAGRDERGNERPEKTLERHPAVGLSGHEGAVDGGEREARELVSDRPPHARRFPASRITAACRPRLRADESGV